MSASTHRKVALVSPIFNDWHAFAEMLGRVGKLPAIRDYEIHVIAVDDCSSERADLDSLNALKGKLAHIRVVRLGCNLGPMRAIAVGLVVASTIPNIDAAIVMDADGEDKPDDVGRLVEAWERQPSKVVVAKRVARSESWAFKFFYQVYRFTFRLLTGQLITFGSFLLLPRGALQALVHNPAIWNNLPAAIVRSRLPYTELDTKRGTRFAGRSRMNFEKSRRSRVERDFSLYRRGSAPDYNCNGGPCDNRISWFDRGRCR